MVKPLTILAFFMLIPLCLIAQTNERTQTVRGRITDKITQVPIVKASVVIPVNGKNIGTYTDSLGEFSFKNIPIGRYNLYVRVSGYDNIVINNVLVNSAKEAVLEVSLIEKVVMMDAVEVTAETDKDIPINIMAMAGARVFSVEEANRYAGGFDDPARLATSFAGVAGGVSSNSISIRGNSPQYLQWRIGGVEIPNPSHYPDITGIGGGILTAFSSMVLANSDFFTGAFPAEYNNALSGVFDIQFRNGNNQHFEHTASVGTLGVEVASEGPLGGRSSYLFNYRYSSLALAGMAISSLAEDIGGMKYQDFSFKLNFPTQDIGTFSLWGIGTFDKYTNDVLKKEEWVYNGDRTNSWTDQQMAAAGFGHKMLIDDDTYLETTLAGTLYNNNLWGNYFDDDLNPHEIVNITDKNYSVVLSSNMNTKFSAWHANKTGFSVTGLFYNMDYIVNPDYPFYYDQPNQTVATGDGSSLLATAYSQSSFNFGKNWIGHIGLNAQYFDLNSNWVLEPRVGIKWKVAPTHSLALAYGLHSRKEKLDYYYVKDSNDLLINRGLDFTKAHHLVMAYDWLITDNIHLKVEPFYQYLYDIPTEEDGSFSLINHNNIHLDKALINKGKGYNYGVDLTLEHYFSSGYYYMITASAFESQYTGGDGIWRSTRNDRDFLINVLYGKEWQLGSSKQNVLGINIRLTYQGGDHYTPLDTAKSFAAQQPVFDDDMANKEQMDPAFMIDFTASYKINTKNLSHEISFKLLNLTGYEENNGFAYYFKTDEFKMLRGAIIIPNISYKIIF
ncbi:MAG: carboxypeptidase-like regulatory domain-containing protein [Ignavibacteria bacterium]|jgi:hypothetical protein|nr:carboxypeptidase-like regulatory domain-containing protein [Ignavibacteria bacterium]